MKKNHKFNSFEIEIKCTFGALICKYFGHSKKRIYGRCNRCLKLLKV